jgi:hypothetical protein
MICITLRRMTTAFVFTYCIGVPVWRGLAATMTCPDGSSVGVFYRFEGTRIAAVSASDRAARSLTRVTLVRGDRGMRIGVASQFRRAIRFPISLIAAAGGLGARLALNA